MDMLADVGKQIPRIRLYRDEELPPRAVRNAGDNFCLPSEVREISHKVCDISIVTAARKDPPGRNSTRSAEIPCFARAKESGAVV